MLALRLIIGSMLLLLTACGLPSEAYEYVGWRTHPSVKVSSTQVAVEEFVEISTVATLTLDHRSPFAQQTVEVHLGVCVIPTDELASQTWCDGPPPHDAPNVFRLPEGFELVEGDTAYKTMEVTVPRGELVTIQHAFRLKATAPSSVTLIGAGVGEPDQPMLPELRSSDEPEDYVTLTFQ